MPRRASQSQSPDPAARVIDAHVHINPLHLLRPEVRSSFRARQPQFDRVVRFTKDPDAFVRHLDAEGIERACLINYVAPRVMGYTPATNGWVHRYVRGHRDRLVAFGGFHPDHARDARKEVERLLSTFEVGGVKFHGPHMLLSPNAYLDGVKGLEVLYGACQSAGVPVMFHTGTSIFPGARNKFGDPLPIDDVAVDFPRLRIILAHVGRPLWMDTAQFLARRHPHVYFDVSSIPPASLLEYVPRLEQLAEKAIFGSDWPGPHVPGMRANADAFARLPLSAGARRRILYDNMRALLPRGSG